MTAQLSPLREGRVTGSRVGTILGLKKDAKAADVLRTMVRDHFGVRPEFVGNAMTEYGNRMEEPARAEYERITGSLVLDAQDFITHPEHDFLGFSPDGLVGADGLIEIKCPSDLARWRTIADKPDFFAQVQLGLACSGRAWAHFCRYRTDEPMAPELVTADPEWLPANLPALAAFHAEYERIIADPKLAAPYRNELVALLDDAESLMDETELAQILAAKEHLDAREQDVRARLIERAEASGSKTARGRFFQVTRVASRGSVRYRDAVAALAPGADLSPFTAPPGEPSFRISRVKEPE